jgi:hypothetical protein
MAIIDNYINVQITRGTRGITSSSLNTMLIIGNTKKAIDAATLPLVKSYSSLAEVAIDYTNAADVEYKAAAAYFAQDPTPRKLLIGRVIGTTVQDTFAAAYPKITLANNEFYGVVITSKVEVDQLAISAIVETDNKIFGVSNENVTMLDGTNINSLAFKIKALNRMRTFVLFSGVGANTYPEAAWMGKLLTKDAGSASWAYKNLSGVISDNLSNAHITGLQVNNCNFYTPLANIDCTFDGKTAGGEYIDIIHGSDWLIGNIQTRIANVFINSNKIAMTDQGITILENMLRAGLAQGVERSIIDRESVKINVPRLADVSIEDRAARRVTLTFEARFSGAIHIVNIKGTISV